MPTVTLAATAGTATVGVGQLWTFTATVAGTDANTLPQRFKWNFGDDSEATTNGNTTSHVYTTPLGAARGHGRGHDVERSRPFRR